MGILPYVLCALAFGVFLYLAFSKKSGPVIRRAARITLILAALSAIVSAVLILLYPAETASLTRDPPPPGVIPEKPAEAPDFKLLLVIAALITGFAVLIALAARQEQFRNKKDRAAPPGAKERKDAASIPEGTRDRSAPPS